MGNASQVIHNLENWFGYWIAFCKNCISGSGESIAICQNIDKTYWEHAYKDLFERKLKKCAYFRLISCHFFANDMIIFHKTEVQKIILRCLTGLNSDWFNNYDTKCKYFHFRFFAILYKNTHLHFLCFCLLCHNFCTT